MMSGGEPSGGSSSGFGGRSRSGSRSPETREVHAETHWTDSRVRREGQDSACCLTAVRGESQAAISTNVKALPQTEMVNVAQYISLP